MGPLPAIPTKCVFHIKYINVEISGLRTAHRLKWFGPVCGSTPFPNLAKPCRSSASGKKCGGRHHIRVVRYCTYIMICVMWFVIYLNYIYIYIMYIQIDTGAAYHIAVVLLTPTFVMGMKDIPQKMKC